MAETEFWRDLKPITKVFKADALPEVFLSDAATEDERYYVPFTDTVSSRPLWISPTQNRWCDILYAKGPGLVNRHYHPQQVFAFTLSGKWGYLEHDWVATAGDFVYEAPGEAHTLVAHEHPDPMKVHFNVTGPLIWLDENGDPTGHFDVFDYIELCRSHYGGGGRGAAAVASLFRGAGGQARLRLQPPALERPPELDQDPGVAQRRLRGLLEPAQPVPQRVRVHVQGARGVLDALALIEVRAQRRLQLGAEPAHAGQRGEVALREGVAERLVGQDGGPDREVRERVG